MHAVAPLIAESSGESPLTVEYHDNGVVRFNAAIRVAIKRYNHAVTWATRHFISLISISKKYESNFKEISKLHLLVVIYECTSGQRKHRKYSTARRSGGEDHERTQLQANEKEMFYHSKTKILLYSCIHTYTLR